MSEHSCHHALFAGRPRAKRPRLTANAHSPTSNPNLSPNPSPNTNPILTFTTTTSTSTATAATTSTTTTTTLPNVTENSTKSSSAPPEEPLVGRVYKDLRYDLAPLEYAQDLQMMAYTALEHKYGPTWMESRFDRHAFPRRRAPAHHVGLQLLTHAEAADLFEPARMDLQRVAALQREKDVVAAENGNVEKRESLKRRCREAAEFLSVIARVSQEAMHAKDQHAKYYLNRDVPLHVLTVTQQFLGFLADDHASSSSSSSATAMNNLNGSLKRTSISADNESFYANLPSVVDDRWNVPSAEGADAEPEDGWDEDVLDPVFDVMTVDLDYFDSST